MESPLNSTDKRVPSKAGFNKIKRSLAALSVIAVQVILFIGLIVFYLDLFNVI